MQGSTSLYNTPSHFYSNFAQQTPAMYAQASLIQPHPAMGHQQPHAISGFP